MEYFGNKKRFKRKASKCQICGEKDYDLLDTHRIKWGGKYSESNCVCLCSTCHRKVHAHKIKIDGWYNSTKGRVLHFFDENGKEHFR
jgi:5-methylcytosine-specific restriction endonuclease McrA